MAEIEINIKTLTPVLKYEIIYEDGRVESKAEKIESINMANIDLETTLNSLIDTIKELE